MCHSILISWQYIAWESVYIGGHKEFLEDSVLFVVAVLVGMMIHVVGGGYISGYDELIKYFRILLLVQVS